MIDRQKFDETFQYFDADLVQNIIDLYKQELPGRLEKILTNIRDKDFENLAFNIHSLRGVTGAFMDPEPTELARKIEEKAHNQVFEGLDDLSGRLKDAAEALAVELTEISGTL